MMNYDDANNNKTIRWIEILVGTKIVTLLLSTTLFSVTLLVLLTQSYDGSDHNESVVRLVNYAYVNVALASGMIFGEIHYVILFGKYFFWRLF